MSYFFYNKRTVIGEHKYLSWTMNINKRDEIMSEIRSYFI